MIKFLAKALAITTLFLLIIFNLDDTRKTQDRALKKHWDAINLQAEKINTVFFGTSLTLSAVDPALFDSLNRNLGLQTNSFNFSLPGMDLLEAQYWVEQILHQDIPNLETIILEINDLTLFLNSANHRTPRIISHHDFKRTLIACKAILNSSYRPVQQYKMIKSRMTFFAKHSFKAGEMRYLVNSLFNDISIPGDSLRNYNGYTQKTVRHPHLQKRRQHFLSEEGKQEYQQKLNGNHRKRNKMFKHYRQTQATALSIVKDILKQCEARKIKIILVSMPSFGERKFLVENLISQQVDCVMLNLDLPEKYQALFARENRFDLNHLNHQGAKLVTAILANTFTEKRNNL